MEPDAVRSEISCKRAAGMAAVVVLVPYRTHGSALAGTMNIVAEPN